MYGYYHIYVRILCIICIIFDYKIYNIHIYIDYIHTYMDIITYMCVHYV